MENKYAPPQSQIAPNKKDPVIEAQGPLPGWLVFLLSSSSLILVLPFVQDGTSTGIHTKTEMWVNAIMYGVPGTIAGPLLIRINWKRGRKGPWEIAAGGVIILTILITLIGLVF